MRLQLESVDISDVQLGKKAHVVDHRLFLDTRELEEWILGDPRIESVQLNLAYPGEKTRIVNIVDVIQPRCKVDRDSEDFPGYLGRLKIAGQGRTRSLRGIAVVVSNSHSALPYHPLIDMFGFGAARSPFGKMINLNVHPSPAAGVSEWDFQSAAKLAGLKTAVYLARTAEGQAVDETEVYDLDFPEVLRRKTNLPRVVHYYQMLTPQYDYRGEPEPLLYGSRAVDMFPTLIHPNEVLDGAVVNPFTNIRNTTTYNIQNHAVIRELYKRHEKELLFVGVVAAVASTEAAQRQRMCMMATRLIKEFLGADGLVLTKVYGGAAHLDPGLVAEECEALGIKTVVFVMSLNSQATLSEQLIYSAPSLNAIVNIGQTIETLRLREAPEKILGGTGEEPYVFDPVRDRGQTVRDENLVLEATLCGLYDHFGGSRIQPFEY